MSETIDKKFRWMAGPIAFVAMLASLLAAWAVLEPATLVRWFDNNGYAPFELATLPFFAAIVPLVWWKCPFGGSRLRRNLLCLAVSLVAVMAIVKEMDLHVAILHFAYPNFVGADGDMLPGLFKPDGRPLAGTPFKLRVLTNAGVPLGMKMMIVGYFAAFFGVFAVGFAYLFPTWVRGMLLFKPAAWTWGVCGLSGVMVQIFDRLPSWLKHVNVFIKHAEGGSVSPIASLCTCLEEGGEMMVAILALLTIWQGFRQRTEK